MNQSGSTLEMYYGERLNSISHLVGAVYLAMGWACSLDFGSVRAALPPAGFWWLASGGIAYSAGVIFYLLDKANRLPHAHGIWHFFVLVGSACHFIAVAGFVR